MRGRIENPERRAEVNRSRSEKQLAYWASPEGEAVKEKMRMERTGVRTTQTEAHRRAMALRRAVNADPIVQARIRDLRRQAREFHDPNAVSEEERAVAAAEGGNDA